MSTVRLDWDEKSDVLPRLDLPLQIVETINSVRASRGTIFEAMASEEDEWRNQLIWGDNLHVLSSLRRTLEGKVDLVYIDPPFDSRQDYKVRIEVGDNGADGVQALSKLSSVIEEKAYRDTWGKGVESYVHMLHTRFMLLRDLLSENGSIFVHLAPTVAPYARVLLDELFPDGYRAEIVWKRTSAHSDARGLGAVHEVIMWYSKGDKYTWNPQYTPYEQAYVDQYYRYQDDDGRRFMSGDLTAAGLSGGGYTYEFQGVTREWRYPPERLAELAAEGRIFTTKNGFPRLKRYLDEAKGQPLSDVWTDIQPVVSWASEQLGYDTQKPEALLERILRMASNPGDLVLDCFAGSGTTAAVAEKLGRRWVTADIGRFAVHTTRKRLLAIPGCSPFIVANLGRYERQVWQSTTTGEAHEAYIHFILELYAAQPGREFQFLHGTREGRAVYVGNVDAPVTQAEIMDAIDEARTSGFTEVDVLGWEFEMGLHELIEDEIGGLGVALRLRRIPREVMEPRAVVAGDVVFHELAYARVEAAVHGRVVTVRLTDFALPTPDLLPASVLSKIENWSDYVDYWAIDFTSGLGEAGSTFHNQWQAYRTREARELELVAQHEYEQPGTYLIEAKVVDIFGNDTTTATRVVVE